MLDYVTHPFETATLHITTLAEMLTANPTLLADPFSQNWTNWPCGEEPPSNPGTGTRTTDR